MTAALPAAAAVSPARVADERAENTGLTALRGTAIFVVLYHFMAVLLGREYPEHTQLFIRAHLLVDGFFMLSGYVICWMYRRQFEDGFRVSRYAGYLAKRLARIYPMHFAAMLAMLVLWWWQYGPRFGPFGVDQAANFPWRPFFRHATMSQSWWVDNPLTLNAPAWSVSVEWAAYLAFPILLAIGSWLARRPLYLAFLLPFLAAVALAALNPERQLNLHDIRGVLRGWIDFTIGIMLFQAMRTRPDHRLWDVLGKDGVVAALFLAVPVAMHFGVPDPVTLMLIAFLVAGASRCRGWMGRAMASAVPNWLGVASYSIYLNHWPVLTLWLFLHGRTVVIGEAADTLIYLLVVLAVSAVTFPLIEAPGRRWLRRAFARIGV